MLYLETAPSHLLLAIGTCAFAGAKHGHSPGANMLEVVAGAAKIFGAQIRVIKFPALLPT